ncbi:lanthionine synthetase [Nocardiopsis gilva YIM 90087]|uniref:Lanthionine synthetase n=2 Tax=Nocardiopsis gilva TaxID=280236 RepID=A0A223S1M1_9ACTN|nr:lanthionine synthetase [Nocardiopsis gilva YIM 90087]
MTAAEDQVGLARTLYADATESITRDPDFTLLLDHALTAMEFRRALGDDGAPSTAARDSFREAMGLLRSASNVGPWLYRGAAQAGWVAIQLARQHGTEASGLAPIDDIVLQWATAFPDDLDIDLPMGLLGLGVYGLAHPEASFREKLTSGILDVIENRTERDENGLFFRLADSEARRADQSAGCRIIGVAHGAAGLVSYLASVSRSDTSVRPRARALLDDALRWLLSQGSDVNGSVFPHRVEMRYAPSRATWCSGDPGVALALSVAAQATGSPGAASAARRTAEAVIARPDGDCGVMDGCVCHGAAGLCWFGRHMSDRFGIAGAGQFADRWVRYLADQRAAGHLTYFGPEGMVRDASFLEGDAGVALALLYTATGVTPVWEQLVLATPITAGA